MKFKIDENISQSAAKLLISKGYDAETVFFENITGIKDGDLLDICIKESRCLITLDKDFINTIDYPPENYPGIIYIKSKSQGKSVINSIIERIIPILETEKIKGKLWLVNEENIKIVDS